jgi:Raf kinase inhibitor-like YbhB/YbcL family protein
LIYYGFGVLILYIKKFVRFNSCYWKIEEVEMKTAHISKIGTIRIAIAALLCLSMIAASVAVNGDTYAAKKTKMTVTSSGIKDGVIADKYGTRGKQSNGVPIVSLPLKIKNAPAKTKYYAVYMYDPDGGNWTHWLAANYKAKTFKENASKKQKSKMVQGKNDFGTAFYGGPTPPSGVHEYVIKVYALSGKVSLKKGYSLSKFKSAVKKKTLATATIKGKYSS